MNWDFHFFTFVSEVQLQLKTHCELGFSFLHVCGWSTITTEDSLWTVIFISSRLWVKYSYNWKLIVNWDFHFFTFVCEVQLQLTAHFGLGFPFLHVCEWSKLQLKTNCELGFPFLHVCEWSTVTADSSLWPGISISSRLWVKYNYNWRLIVNWNFHFFTFVCKVQLQLTAHFGLGFPFLDVYEWSTAATAAGSLWCKFYTCRPCFWACVVALGTAPVTNAMWCYSGLCSAVLYYMLRDVQRFMDDNSGVSPSLQLAHSASPPTP